MSDIMLQPISVRYKQVAAEVLENLRNDADMNLTAVMVKYNCLLPENPTEEDLAEWEKFRSDIYPALPRLKDLRAKTLEALHHKAGDAKRLSAEPISNLTQLLKTLDHDIEVASGNALERGSTTNNVFIFNNDQANRIAARLTARVGKVDSYAVEE